MELTVEYLQELLDETRAERNTLRISTDTEYYFLLTGRMHLLGELIDRII